jgi:hypothetical protein
MRLFSCVSIAIPFGDSMAINLDRTFRNERKRRQIVENPLSGEKSPMKSSQRYSGFLPLPPLLAPSRRKTTTDSNNEKLFASTIARNTAAYNRIMSPRLFYAGVDEKNWVDGGRAGTRG